MRNRMRMTAAAAVAAIIAVTGGTAAAAAATASASPSPTVSGKPVPPPGPGKPGKPGQKVDLKKIAAQLHVSLAALENALRDVKITVGKLGVPPTSPAAVKVFAHDLGISQSKARFALKEIFGKQPPPGKTPPPSPKPSPSKSSSSGA